ncbi:MAG: ABC transporter substrate-binding protein [Acidimicrobiales bacterium]
MARHLSLACWDYDRTLPLSDGRVRPEGIELTYLNLPVEETFFRMSRHGEFDAAEMSLSTYVLTQARGRPFVAIPVFPSRAFRHNGIYVHSGAGITKPEDLRGRVVGVPEYQVTAAVWIRGILAEHHGLPVGSVSYRTGGLRRPGRIEKVQTHPDGVEILPIGEHATLEGMLVSGEIDALYTPRTPEPFLARDPAVRRLFEDARAEEVKYFERTGIFPIMHTVVIRREVYDRDPWVANSMFKAFCEAKALVTDRLDETAASPSILPWCYDDASEARRLMGHDFWSYGVAANDNVLRTFLRYSYEQGLADRLYGPLELFPPATVESYVI